MKRWVCAALLLGACTKEQAKVTVGPMTVLVHEGFVDDPKRAGKLDQSPLTASNRVWVEPKSKMQLGLSLQKLSHQAEWDTLPRRDVLSEMVNQELTAGEKAGLQTVKAERRFEGEVLHFQVNGQLKELLATVSHTALWIDAQGDCWHASAVCTVAPAQRAKCQELVNTVQFDVKP